MPITCPGYAYDHNDKICEASYAVYPYSYIVHSVRTYNLCTNEPCVHTYFAYSIPGDKDFLCSLKFDIYLKYTDSIPVCIYNILAQDTHTIEESYCHNQSFSFLSFEVYTVKYIYSIAYKEPL